MSNIIVYNQRYQARIHKTKTRGKSLIYIFTEKKNYCNNSIELYYSKFDNFINR